MTRSANQITPLQTITGMVAIIAVATVIVTVLGRLIDRSEQRPPLGAPAQDEQDDTCPDAPLPEPVTVSAADLIECPDTFDGATVHYTGEAVRAVLHRGARAWVHLNDDRYALELGPLYEHRTTVGGNSGVPVSIPAGVADDITYVGDARHRGAILTVTGEFRRANPDDGGGPGIHADTARITDPGRPVGRPVDGARIVTAAVVFAAALAAAFLAHNDTSTRPPTRRR
ncbi:MAG: hypothetical protein KY460_16545 [Actinobacteria bacterium]|nr:hypothetical protein [Actinomycetota bacterium]